MLTLQFSILALALILGQLIKIPLSQGGITALDLAVFLIAVWQLIQQWPKIKIPLFIKMAGLFFVVCLISLALSPLKLDVNQYLISFFYSLRFLIFILFGLIIYNLTAEKKQRLKTTLASSGIIIAILGVLQFLLLPDLRFLENLGWDPHYFRAVSTFLDPNFLGAFLTLVLITFIQSFAIAKNWIKIISFSLIYFCLLVTFSRSSYLMFLVSIATIAVLEKSKKKFLLGLLLFLGLMLGFFIYTHLISTPRHIDRSASASYRFTTWQHGLRLFQKSPIFGVGFNSYRLALKQYNLADNQFLQSHGSTSNDSSLLFVLATTGLVGLIAYSAFIISLITHGLKNIFSDNLNALVLIGAVSGLLIHSIFNNSLFYPPILLMLVALAGIINDAGPKK